MKNKFYLSSILFLAFFHFQMVVSAKVKVACVGNSITAGYLLASPQSYPSVLQSLMGTNYEVQNFGVSGTTYLVSTGDSWSYWGSNGKLNQVVSYLPNKIIIELGTNDSKSSYTSYRNVLEADIEKMILKFKALASNPEIFLCIPIPALNSNFDIQSSVIENEIIPKIRQAAQNQNVKLIDLHTIFSDHHELYTDGIHPNEAGARIIAGIVYMNIAPIVKVTGVSLNLSDLSIVEGEVKSLTPTIQPSTASVKEVLWSSDHPEIATVSASGQVSGVAVGSCIITTHTLDGNFIATCSITVAKSNKFTFKTSWIGNTFGGGDKWVQNFIDAIQVQPDGTVYTTSVWDEAGRNYGIYKNGDVIGNQNKNIIGKKATSNNGIVWTIQANRTIQSSDGKSIVDVVDPTSIAFDNQNRLMVTENGPRQQVLIYNVSSEPILESTFGTEGGLFSGIPGESGPLKFHNLSGVGVDASNNIYVSMSSGPIGCELESYSPSGTRLWHVASYLFVDVADFDRTTNGTDVYTKNAHFIMDYTKPAGQQWICKARTLNHIKYPQDARINSWGQGRAYLHPAANWIRYIDGKKIQVTTDMFSDQLRFYRFNAVTDGEIAIPSVNIAKFNLYPFLFNIQNFQIDTNTHNATKWDQQFGITNEDFATVANINNGDYIIFNEIDFGTGATTFKASTATPLGGGKIEIRIDSINGQLLGTCVTSNTGGWGTYKDFSTNLTGNVSGVHKLYMVFKYFDNAWPPNQPDRGEWIWTDGNGNGQMDAGEYQNYGKEAPVETRNYWVDMKGDIWQLNGAGIRVLKIQGLDPIGNPKYDFSNTETYTIPEPFKILRLIEYSAEKDELYLIGQKEAAGTYYLSRYKNWRGNNRIADLTISLPTDLASFCIEGDYAFVAESRSAAIHIYNLLTAMSEGILTPGAEVSGQTGWIDIPYGVRAYKKTDGEFLIFAEEDAKGKNILYRWTPGIPNEFPTVKIVTPEPNQTINFTGSSATIPVLANAASVGGYIKRVEFYIDNVWKSTIRNEPFTFDWKNVTPGTYKMYAIAFDHADQKTNSDTISFVVQNITSISDKNKFSHEVVVFPNPLVNNEFTIKMNTSGNSIISIYDLNGIIVFTTYATTSTIVIPNLTLKPGFYIVNVINNNLSTKVKLVVR